MSVPNRVISNLLLILNGNYGASSALFERLMSALVKI